MTLALFFMKKGGGGVHLKVNKHDKTWERGKGLLLFIINSYVLPTGETIILYYCLDENMCGNFKRKSVISLKNLGGHSLVKW